MYSRSLYLLHNNDEKKQKSKVKSKIINILRITVGERTRNQIGNEIFKQAGIQN
jgi:hypothetical protein